MIIEHWYMYTNEMLSLLSGCAVHQDITLKINLDTGDNFGIEFYRADLNFTFLRRVWKSRVW